MLQPKEEAMRGEKTTLAAVLCNALARETTELGRAHRQIMSTIPGPRWREGGIGKERERGVRVRLVIWGMGGMGGELGACSRRSVSFAVRLCEGEVDHVYGFRTQMEKLEIRKE